MLVPPWDWYDQQEQVLKILHQYRVLSSTVSEDTLASAA